MASPISKVMSIIDENVDKLPDGVYLELCNELKKIHGDQYNKVLKFTDYTDQEQYICRNSLIEFDEFVRYVEDAIDIDREYYEWCHTFENWKKGGGNVPEKYYKPCVSRFMAVNYMMVRGKSPYPNFTAQGLRDKGIEIPQDDQEFYSEWFPQLRPWYTEQIHMAMVGGSADDQWRVFSNTEGFESLLHFVQRGWRAIQWRRKWHERLSQCVFRDTDASVTGGHVKLDLEFVYPDNEPYESDSDSD